MLLQKWQGPSTECEPGPSWYMILSRKDWMRGIQKFIGLTLALGFLFLVDDKGRRLGGCVQEDPTLEYED